MTIKGDTISDADDYQIRMLMENNIDGFCFINAKFADRLVFIVNHLFTY